MANQGRNIGKALYMGLAALVLASCDMMHDDLDDCKTGTTDLRVDFRYDMNLKWADAFEHEVKNVTLYAYDGNGQLAYQKSESVADIIGRGGYMDVNGIVPSHYTLKVWAEGENRHDNSWTYGLPTNDGGNISQLDCRLNRSEADINHDLTPLFHGLVADADLTKYAEDSVLSKNPTYSVRTATVPLMKNTNTVRVVMYEKSGETLNADDYVFTITDDNGYMAYDNSLLADDAVRYHEWAKNVVAVEKGDASGESYSGVSAELTTARLMADKQPLLTVTNKLTGETVLTVPLVKTALLFKGEYYKDIDDQEYLDRQDEYNYVFFLDKGKWLDAVIWINSWRVVFQTTDLGE